MMTHFDAPENVPKKTTPAEIPFVPLPSTLNVPPPARVAPLLKDSLVKATLVNDTVPRSPATMLPPLNPVITMRVEPESASPPVPPVNLPAIFLRSVTLWPKDWVEKIRLENNNSEGTRNLPGKFIADSVA